MMNKKRAMIGFITTALPNILFLATLVLAPSQSDLRSILLDPSNIGGGLLCALFCLVIPGINILSAVATGLLALMGIFAVPCVTISGDCFGLGAWSPLFGLTLWLFCIALLWTHIYAFKFKLGSFQENSSYVSGSHYEIEFDNSGKGTIKKVNEYSGGGEWIVNTYIYWGRIFAILFCGIFYYIDGLFVHMTDNDRQTSLHRFNKVLISLCLFLIGWGCVIWFFPLFAFKYLHFSSVIIFYIIAAIYIFVCSIKYVRKPKKAGIILCTISFTALVICACIFGQHTLYISSSSDMKAFMNIPNAENRNYALTCDIDFQGETMNVPFFTNEFKGTFEGNNHSIRNLTIDMARASVGFIQQNGGHISNVRFEDIAIKGFARDDYAYAGIIAAINSGEIRNCLVVNCSIEMDSGRYTKTYIGGGVGINHGTICDFTYINQKDEIDMASGVVYGISGKSTKGAIHQNCYVYRKRANDIYAYDSSLNRHTLEAPITVFSDFPIEISTWRYSKEFECYIPCSGFDTAE